MLTTTLYTTNNNASETTTVPKALKASEVWEMPLAFICMT